MNLEVIKLLRKINKMKKIYIAGDHAGLKLKLKIKKYLENLNFKVFDFGPLEYDSTDDYPDFVIPLAKKISKEKGSKGIVIAGSGQGEAIAMNKFKNVRAALYHGGNTKIVQTGRAHDNSNILSFGSRFITETEAKRAIKIFLNTGFDEGRHRRRLNKIKKMVK